MNYYLIKFTIYRSLGDGDHEEKTIKRLVKDDSYEGAKWKLEKKFPYHILSNFENLTIE